MPGQSLIQVELDNIRNHAYDIKKHVALLFPRFLANSDLPQALDCPSLMTDEQTLPQYLDQDYPNQQYVLFLYAHKPHSIFNSPVYPREEKFHTSLLLCKVRDNRIAQVINIDAYDRVSYVDILGERPGAQPNPMIGDRMVIRAQPDTQSPEFPLQRPDWYNMNCVIYALTLAQKIRAVFAKKSLVIEALFPENPREKAPPAARAALQTALLEEMVGTYVREQDGRYFTDPVLHQQYHQVVRETLANDYALQQNTRTATSQSTPSAIRKSPAFFQNPGRGPTATQHLAISKLINKLERERACCWPYPNKERKLLKVNALTTLLTASDLCDAVRAIEHLPGVRDGHLSTRTSRLLDQLLASTQGRMPSPGETNNIS